jgi:hypothetical protein
VALGPGKGKGLPLLSRLPSTARHPGGCILQLRLHAFPKGNFMPKNLITRKNLITGSMLRMIGLVAVIAFSLAPSLAQSPTSDTQAAAKELIATMKLDEQFKALMPMILNSIKPAIVQNRADVDKDFDALAPALMSGFNARMSELTEAVAAIYASNFSAEELRAATAFYQTPAGQKFLQKTPQVAQLTMAAGQKFGQSVGAEAQQRMMDELRSKGHDL